MTNVADPRVDAYITELPAWQQAICQEVREILHEADPDIVETIKRTVQPYFVLDGNVAALQATKDHVNVVAQAQGTLTFLKAFNSALDEYKDEGRAFAVAHSAAQRAPKTDPDEERSH